MSLLSKIKKEDRWILGNTTDNPLLYAFDGKPVIDPRLDDPRENIPNNRLQLKWRDLTDHKEPAQYNAVYLHIPFCVSRCPFCRFFENPYNEEKINQYVKTLKNEIALFGNLIHKPVNAIYFGGGTPTVLSPIQIIQLLKQINKFIPIANDCELTFESNLYSLDEKKLDACLSSGVNRFSFGVQSFNTDIRRKMGRKLERTELFNKITMIKDIGRSVISIDLIYGLPGQEMSTWEDDIRIYLRLGIEGIDLYQLEETQLKKISYKGKLQTPNEKALLFKRANELLSANGYEQLTITHWRRSTRERYLYSTLTRSGINPVNTDVYPFGSSSYGVLRGHSFRQVASINKYQDMINSGKKPIEFILKPAKRKLNDDIIAQLDCGFVNFHLLHDRYAFDLKSSTGLLLKEWEEKNLITFDDNGIMLTLAGKFWKVNLIQGLLTYIRKYT